MASIKVKNYKCFGDEEQGFNTIKPFNIIIGKNNSGKSSLIELIENVVKHDNKFYTKTRSTSPEIIITDTIKQSWIEGIFSPHEKHNYSTAYASDYEFALEVIVGTKMTYKLIGNGGKETVSLDATFHEGVKMKTGHIIHQVEVPLCDKIFRRISSERDINSEGQSDHPSLNSKGVGATNFIQSFINSTTYDSKLVEKDLLRELNKIINPEISFTHIRVRRDGSSHWEIYFEQFNEVIPLSKMGSGIKTILLVLINLHLIPILENKSKSDYVFAFEELENNLHPSMQRKLFNYLREYAETNKCLFFLTTHSNVVIDLFTNDELSQISHVYSDGTKTLVNDIVNFYHSKKVIEDLDIRASDILQSNGIIWVEGPSDRIYIQRWIQLMSPELKEGIHYSIMFYGGRLLSRVHFLTDFIKQELIPLLRINHNAYVVIDRDAKKISNKLNETKQRIAEEIGESSCWITAGREIENYIGTAVIERWLQSKYGNSKRIKLDKYEKIEQALSAVSTIKYELDKVKYANEISEVMTADDLNGLDLREKISGLVEIIKRWNKI